jgi:hypothetical protein
MRQEGSGAARPRSGQASRDANLEVRRDPQIKDPTVILPGRLIQDLIRNFIPGKSPDFQEPQSRPGAARKRRHPAAPQPRSHKPTERTPQRPPEFRPPVSPPPEVKQQPWTSNPPGYGPPNGYPWTPLPPIIDNPWGKAAQGPATANYFIMDYKVSLPPALRARAVTGVTALFAGTGGLLCSPFGGGARKACAAAGGGIGAFAGFTMIPDWVRVRTSTAWGQARPGDPDGVYNLVSFGMGRTYYQGLRKPWDLAGVMADGLAHYMFPQVFKTGEQHAVSAALIFSLLSKGGGDVEYDIAWTRPKEGEKPKVTVGIRLSATGKLQVLKNKTTVAVQAQVEVSDSILEDLNSGERTRVSAAVAKIAFGNLLNAPLETAVRAAGIDLGLTDGNLADIVPKGGYIFRRFGAEGCYENKLFDSKKLGKWETPKASVCWGPLAQGGFVTTGDGKEYMSFRLLAVGSVDVGLVSIKPQGGGQWMWEIGSKGRSDPTKIAAALREFKGILVGSPITQAGVNLGIQPILDGLRPYVDQQNGWTPAQRAEVHAELNALGDLESGSIGSRN